MLDLTMLEMLTRPSGAGGAAPALERVFSHIVTNGWAPRLPAFGAELEQLNAITVRGDCIWPLLQAGDTVYIDPKMPAQSGDVVLFALSKRGAEAQNSDLPPGQSPCRPRDLWCKLAVWYRNIGPMLLDRYGSSACATLLACESPEDTPILHPVRQIVRAGRLLFAPEAFAGQIGFNAATLIGSSSYSTATTMNSTWQTFVAVTVVSDGTTVPVVVTGHANAALGSLPTGEFRLTLDGVTVQTPLGWNSNMAGLNWTSSFDYSTTLSVGTHTFAIQGINTSGGATFENAALNVGLMKR